MNSPIFFAAGKSAALEHAVRLLTEQGFCVLSEPDSTVTHLLLPIPSFDADNSVKGGVCLEQVLSQLPKSVTVFGGNLSHPSLAEYKTVDLLQDDEYLAKNADITAHCAIRLAMQMLPVTLAQCNILIIGWGRIGKCLARLLHQLGANVTVSARKSSDRAMLLALGYRTCNVSQGHTLAGYRVIFNTVPVMVLQEPACSDNCLKIDLASKLGIGGDNVIWARGLPGKDAPESSGALIAQRVVQIIGERIE